MIIFWRGCGIFVVVITIVILVIFQKVAGAVSGDPRFYQSHDWPKGAALLCAAAAVYLAGRYFNNRPGRVMIDKATGREVIFPRVHSLFFIRMEYWGFILAALGVVCLFTHIGKAP